MNQSCSITELDVVECAHCTGAVTTLRDAPWEQHDYVEVMSNKERQLTPEFEVEELQSTFVDYEGQAIFTGLRVRKAGSKWVSG